MTKYNGHRSWNAWNVSLWINNDESLYTHARDMAKRHGIGVAASRPGATAKPLGCVRAISPAGITGVYNPVYEKIMSPDLAAVAACLPHSWRKAYHRANGFWYRDGSPLAHCTLYNTRGARIATIWAKAYYFEQGDTGLERVSWRHIMQERHDYEHGLGIYNTGELTA